MFVHNIIISIRNLWKYKTQNIISIIGLAVGFVCFSFSALWIRYEMSYDSFHENVDRIYRVNIALNKWNTVETGVADLVQSNNPYLLANWLKSNYPEIEEASGVMPLLLNETVRNDEVSLLIVDQAFCRIFNVPVPKEFFISGSTDKPVAVTDNFAADLESIRELYGDYLIQATVPAWSANTNIPFNMLTPFTVHYPDERFNRWNFLYCDTYVLIHDGVDIAAFKEKLDKIEIPEFRETPISLILTPLKQLRYKDPAGNIQSDIKFAHIRIFTIAGLLVILCSILNHLTQFVTRARMRLRELALRKVSGASDWQIAITLYTDFLLVVVLSLFAGLMLIVFLLPAFKEYATIGSNNVNIYLELLLYAVLLIVCGFVSGGIPVLYFREKVLNRNIKSHGNYDSRNLFRKGSLLVQLIFSLVMMFCVIVFIKQIRFLHNQPDIIINSSNIAFVQPRLTPPDFPPIYADQIKQVPGIVDAIPVTGVQAFLQNRHPSETNNYVDSTGTSVSLTNNFRYEDARFFEFFGLKIIEGTVYPNEKAIRANAKFVLNETAMKEVGEFWSTNANFMGVVQDFYISPTAKVQPIRFFYSPLVPAVPDFYVFTAIAYKYEEGLRQQTQQAVTQWFYAMFPDQGEFEIGVDYTEDLTVEHFKSERALLTLLSIMTFACILIAVFGVYSLTSLTCQQRRKEIAIRKVHGADVFDILSIFFKEYLILLAVAAIVAFPAGYVIMKRWLEGYVKQTTMDACIFVAIFLILFVVIVISIFSTVWRAANQNPAEVVKSE